MTQIVCDSCKNLVTPNQRATYLQFGWQNGKEEEMLSRISDMCGHFKYLKVNIVLCSGKCVKQWLADMERMISIDLYEGGKGK